MLKLEIEIKVRRTDNLAIKKTKNWFLMLTINPILEIHIKILNFKKRIQIDRNKEKKSSK